MIWRYCFISPEANESKWYPSWILSCLALSQIHVSNSWAAELKTNGCSVSARQTDMSSNITCFMSHIICANISFDLLWLYYNPDSKVHGANMGSIWGRQDRGGPYDGPMTFAIWEAISGVLYIVSNVWAEAETFGLIRPFFVQHKNNLCLKHESYAYFLWVTVVFCVRSIRENIAEMWLITLTSHTRHSESNCRRLECFINSLFIPTKKNH